MCITECHIGLLRPLVMPTIRVQPATPLSKNLATPLSLHSEEFVPSRRSLGSAPASHEMDLTTRLIAMEQRNRVLEPIVMALIKSTVKNELSLGLAEIVRV